MGIPNSLGHTWFWKDDLHSAKRIFYSRVFRKRPGYIAIDWAPVFIATNGRPADELIFEGKITAAAREVYETVERCGPISSKDLRKMLPAEVGKASANALIDLERRFVVTKVDITGRDQHTYSYVWDLAERWIPAAFEEADRLGEITAARLIVERLREMDLDVTRDMMVWLLDWDWSLASSALDD